MTTLEFRNPSPLLQGLANALLFADTESTATPTLAGVHFEYDAYADRLELQATDRYRASFETVEHKAAEDAESFAFTLPRKEASQLVKALKGADKLSPVTLAYEPKDASVAVEVDGCTYRHRVNVTAFPSLRDKTPPPASRERVAVNARFLADLGKVVTGDPRPTVTFTFAEGMQPIVAEFAGGPTVLVMPIRLPEKG